MALPLYISGGALVIPLPWLLLFAALATFVWTCKPRTVHLLPPEVRREIYYARHRHDPDWREVDVARRLATDCPRTGKQYVVIGAGFLGRRIVHMLLLRGETKVRVVDMAKPPPLSKSLLARVEYVCADITDRAQMDDAVRDAHVVLMNAVYMCFHERLPQQVSRAKKINVGGARNVADACAAAGVQVLIYTSSAHASMGPGTVSLNMTEDTPRASREPGFFNHYCWTKAAAEKLVCEASAHGGESGLRTGVIRPCSGVFGFDDKLIMEYSLKEDAMNTWDGDAIDMVFVDNVAYGHLLCEAKLLARDPRVEGQVFGVSNNEPLPDLEFKVNSNAVTDRVVRRPRTIRAFAGGPPLFVLVIAWTAEFIAEHFPSVDLGRVKLLTPAVLAIQRAPYAFDCSKARDVLGYVPLYTLHQAYEKSADEFEADAILPKLP